MSRLLAVVVGAVVVLVGVFVLAQLFVARDDAGVSSRAARGPGTLEPDRGADHGVRAAPGGPLPTSGAHSPDLVPRDGGTLTRDQLLHALELGNVVLLYPGDSPPPPALRALQEEVAGPFDAELAAAGQAVILAEGGSKIEALAWRRRLAATGLDDPALREFADAWLGQGR